MNTSRAAVRVVESLNAKAGKTVAAYTFDAGPNAVIYYLAENESRVAGVIKSFIAEKEGWGSARGEAIDFQDSSFVDEVAKTAVKEGVSRVILTAVGEGPIKVDDHLINEKGEAGKDVAVSAKVVDRTPAEKRGRQDLYAERIF